MNGGANDMPLLFTALVIKLTQFNVIRSSETLIPIDANHHVIECVAMSNPNVGREGPP